MKKKAEYEDGSVKEWTTDAQQKTDIVPQRKRMAMGADINGQAYNGKGNTEKVKHGK